MDLRGSGRSLSSVLKEAFQKTGVKLESFAPTKFGKTLEGKTIPVEWRSPSGAEVSIDFGHYSVDNKGNWVTGPDAPHVGWQQPDKGGPVGHFIIESLLAGRPR